MYSLTISGRESLEVRSSSNKREHHVGITRSGHSLIHEVKAVDDIGEDVCVAVLLDVNEELRADHETTLLVGGHTQHFYSSGTRLKVCGQGGRRGKRRKWAA